MAANLNSVHLIGTLTRDPELRHVGAAKTAVTDISLAINDRRKDAAGNWVEETTYVDVTCWGKQAEVVSQYSGKGHQVFVEGKLKLDSWTDKTSGEKRSRLKVICDRMQLLGSPKGHGGPQGQPGNAWRTAQQQRPAPSNEFGDDAPAGGVQVDDADVPF